MPSYIATYIVTNNVVSVSTDGTQQLSTVIGEKAYLYISLTATTQCMINLANYMLFEKNLVYTTELQNIASSLTDLQIASYTSTDIPLQDQNAGGYDNRLVTYDPYITSGVSVDWTSIYTPDIIDDNYQRDELNDLVISSTTKNLANCLVSVNGVFHKTYFFNNQLYVQNGFANIKTSKQNRVFVYDTTSLGGHFTVPITSANIDASNNAPFSGVTLTFPNTSFVGMTLLLVLGGYLYVLDGSYEIINTNRILINTCKIDLIHQFLDDPNTSFVQNNYEVVAEDTSISSAPQIADEITYYLQSVYPTALANQISLVNFIDFSAISSGSSDNGYSLPTEIVGSLPMSTFTDPRWVYALLTQPNSFLIAINNPRIYKRTYHLCRSQIPGQYLGYSADTPRGILQYNFSKSFPFLIYAEASSVNYDISIGYRKTNADVYKTIINPTYIPSPILDKQCDGDYPVRLLELYSPSL